MLCSLGKCHEQDMLVGLGEAEALHSHDKHNLKKKNSCLLWGLLEMSGIISLCDSLLYKCKHMTKLSFTWTNTFLFAAASNWWQSLQRVEIFVGVLCKPHIHIYPVFTICRGYYSQGFCPLWMQFLWKTKSWPREDWRSRFYIRSSVQAISTGYVSSTQHALVFIVCEYSQSWVLLGSDSLIFLDYLMIFFLTGSTQMQWVLVWDPWTTQVRCTLLALPLSAETLFLPHQVLVYIKYSSDQICNRSSVTPCFLASHNWCWCAFHNQQLKKCAYAECSLIS